MTIQAFSEKTGIAKSTLRFYESKNLLHPKRDEANGYRMYSKDQIAEGKLISSLRLADIAINDIQEYLKEDETTQQEMMQRWVETIRQRQHLLSVSLRYLESDQKNEQIYLLEKDAEMVIWFAAESEPGNFGSQFQQKKEALRQYGVRINNCYLKYHSGSKEWVKAQIGFGVSKYINVQVIPGVDTVEQMDACICIIMPFNNRFINIESGYRKIIHYAMDHNWMPSSAIFEWYRGDQFEEMDIVMPVTRIM